MPMMLSTFPSQTGMRLLPTTTITWDTFSKPTSRLTEREEGGKTLLPARGMACHQQARARLQEHDDEESAEDAGRQHRPGVTRLSHGEGYNDGGDAHQGQV